MRNIPSLSPLFSFGKWRCYHLSNLILGTHWCYGQSLQVLWLLLSIDQDGDEIVYEITTSEHEMNRFCLKPICVTCFRHSSDMIQCYFDVYHRQLHVIKRISYRKPPAVEIAKRVVLG